MNSGIVIIHGYTGSADTLSGLYQDLCSQNGSGSVTMVRLPFHGKDETPDFMLEDFEDAIMAAATGFLEQGRQVVFIGHSTGGNLALSCIKKNNLVPALLILAGTPKKIDTGYINRWQNHKKGEEPSFASVAKMISHINKTGKIQFEESFPVLVLSAANDQLVPCNKAQEWADSFSGSMRNVIIPGADHHFKRNGQDHALFTDIVGRAVCDVKNIVNCSDDGMVQLIKAEPELSSFLKRSDTSKYHVLQCPGTQRVSGGNYSYPEFVGSEPVFANIEITTHCQLACRFCARTKMGIAGKHMSPDKYLQILDMLPNAYRITLVGLGEPLLHPDIINLVKQGSARKRRMALVTNAMGLDAQMAQALLDAGLESVAFSLDCHSQELADRLRPGTDLEKVVNNIKTFTSLEKKSGRQISKAVFGALSRASLSSLEELTGLVSKLGVDVLMLSDLNFESNTEHSLQSSIDETGMKHMNEVIGRAFIDNLPVLCVHGIEEFGLRQRYKEYLAIPASKICKRSQKHEHCLSPWQTIPVNVDGDITICDCQPEKKTGNLFQDRFNDIWNGPALREQRLKMRSDHPPACCRCCPRF